MTRFRYRRFPGRRRRICPADARTSGTKQQNTQRPSVVIRRMKAKTPRSGTLRGSTDDGAVGIQQANHLDGC